MVGGQGEGGGSCVTGALLLVSALHSDVLHWIEHDPLLRFASFERKGWTSWWLMHQWSVLIVMQGHYQELNSILDLIPQHQTNARSNDAGPAAVDGIEAVGGGQSKTQWRLQREREQVMQRKMKGGKGNQQQQGQQQKQQQEGKQETEGVDGEDDEMQGSEDEGVDSDNAEEEEEGGEGEEGGKEEEEEGEEEEVEVEGEGEEGGDEEEGGDHADGDINASRGVAGAEGRDVSWPAAVNAGAVGSSSRGRGRKQLLQTFVFSATLALPAKMHKRLRRGGGGSSGAATLENLMDR